MPSRNQKGIKCLKRASHAAFINGISRCLFLMSNGSNGIWKGNFKCCLTGSRKLVWDNRCMCRCLKAGYPESEVGVLVTEPRPLVLCRCLCARVSLVIVFTEKQTVVRPPKVHWSPLMFIVRRSLTPFHHSRYFKQNLYAVCH